VNKGALGAAVSSGIERHTLYKDDLMRKVSLCNSILVLALGGITQACASPVDGDDGQPLEDEAAEAAAAIVHNTPKVPVVIDGVQYAPEDIHRFDGRALYMIVDVAQPDVLLAFTRQSDFRAAVDERKAAAKGGDTSQFVPGQYADYFSGDDCTGDKLTIYSGWGVNDLRAVGRGCFLGWCPGDWNDVISSLWINGSQTLYSDIQYGGATIWVGGWGCLNLSPHGFDNIASSLNVW
jgi:hypothetical protein